MVGIIPSRKDLLKAWVDQESGGAYWGRSSPFRMTEGGADEQGSFGYNQIIYRYTPYGKNTCTSLVGANLYKPKNNLLGQVAFSATKYFGSFYYAFNTGVWKVNFVNDDEATLKSYGYKDSSGNYVKVKSGSEALVPDTYERLVKALAGYNGDNERVLKCSLPDMLVNTNKTWTTKKKNDAGEMVETEHDRDCGTAGSQDTLKGYAEKILHDGGNKLSLPYRVYIWKGGKYPKYQLDDQGDEVKDSNGQPILHPKSEQDWCFAYGEEEWLGKISWSDAKDYSERYALGKPKDKTTDYRAECN